MGFPKWVYLVGLSLNSGGLAWTNPADPANPAALSPLMPAAHPAEAAKKRGRHVGRPQALVGSRRAEAGRMLAAGKSQIETARILRVSRVSRVTIQWAHPGGSGRR
jgi:hypothetical protein